jgi:hypothetical protein
VEGRHRNSGAEGAAFQMLARAPDILLPWVTDLVIGGSLLQEEGKR